MTALRSPGRVALAMYDLPELAAATNALLAAIVQRLPGLGVDPVIDQRSDVTSVWASPDLVLGQACGWPLVTTLTDLAVVGTFAHRCGEHGGNGTYRSVIVRRCGAVDGGRRIAANSPDSLSGWIGVLRPNPRATCAPIWPENADEADVVWTGSHRASLAALRDGHADLASIDAVTFDVLTRLAPAEVDGVEVLDRGPVVPELPLITRRPELVPALRDLLAEMSVQAPPALGIAGFVRLDRSDYERALVR